MTDENGFFEEEVTVDYIESRGEEYDTVVFYNETEEVFSLLCPKDEYEQGDRAVLIYKTEKFTTND